MILNKKLTSTILILIFGIFLSKVSSQDEKYYFRGDFDTSALSNPKSNNIGGTADLLITRSEGVYKFQYNISLNNFNGNDYFSSRVAGPSAPQKEDGQLKLALSYTDPTVSDSVFIGQGTQSLSMTSPANNLIPPILKGLTSDTENSNYEIEQFYIVFNIKSDTSPVTRAQLFYVGSTNLPIEGGGVNPNGSSSTSPSDSEGSSSTSTTPYPSSTASNLPNPNSESDSDASSTTTSYESSSKDDSSLNPGGVVDSNSNDDNDGHSSDSSLLLPTLGFVSLFVLFLVIMS